MVITPDNKTSGYRSFRSSLRLISDQFALRCDTKIADRQFRELIDQIRKAPFKELGEFLPNPFVKGIQPNYLESPTEDSVGVINTLSIQNLSLDIEACHHISSEAFQRLADSKKLNNGDVLLTVDGGVSIGKPLNFAAEQEMAMDSHIVALRPHGISSIGLTYLLASPICQQQFRRAESGASGQTSVTEDDVRRFIVPTSLLNNIEQMAVEIDVARSIIRTKRSKLDEEERTLLARLSPQSTCCEVGE